MLCAEGARKWVSVVAKILVVEDSEDILESIKEILEIERYQVEAISDGIDAELMLKTYPYDLIVMDWQLPNKDGVDVVREYRLEGGKTPVLMLTGKANISDKEQGFDAGADDYLTKPFHSKELVARVKALLRRPPEFATSVLKGAGIELDSSTMIVLKDGKSIQLLPKEFQILEFFLRNQERVFDQESLLNRLWPSDSEATSEALRSTIKRLRKKIDPYGEIIKTVHGIGYVFRNTP